MLPSSVTEGAVCLDGSPYGYYLQKGDPTKWIIHIQGINNSKFLPSHLIYLNSTIKYKPKTGVALQTYLFCYRTMD